MFLPLELAMILVFPLAESFGSFSIGKRITTSFVSLSISTFIILFVKWWRWTGSNRRPSECKSDALPTELHPQLFI